MLVMAIIALVWANSPFATTLMSALFPPFFRSLVIEAGLPVSDATAFWGYTASAALLIAAFIAPVLGAVSDFTGYSTTGSTVATRAAERDDGDAQFRLGIRHHGIRDGRRSSTRWPKRAAPTGDCPCGAGPSPPDPGPDASRSA